MIQAILEITGMLLGALAIGIFFTYRYWKSKFQIIEQSNLELQMMKEELEMQEETKTPFGMGAATFVAFVSTGLIPLLIYLYDYLLASTNNLFTISSTMTGLVFLSIGYLKSSVTGSSKWRGMMETLLLGGAAAVLSYFVGDWLEGLIAA